MKNLGWTSVAPTLMTLMILTSVGVARAENQPATAAPISADQCAQSFKANPIYQGIISGVATKHEARCEADSVSFEFQCNSWGCYDYVAKISCYAEAGPWTSVPLPAAVELTFHGSTNQEGSDCSSFYQVDIYPPSSCSEERPGAGVSPLCSVLP
jgi:hypothetical protein